jgi:hypothetical protein
MAERSLFRILRDLARLNASICVTQSADRAASCQFDTTGTATWQPSRKTRGCELLDSTDLAKAIGNFISFV